MINKIFKKFYIFIFFVYKFFKKNTKKQNIVIFGAMNGKYYGDNSKYLFEWILKNEPKVKVMWVTDSSDVYKYLKIKKMPVLMINSFKAFNLLNISKVALFTNSLKDISAHYKLVPSNIRLISLRHGRSVKRVRFARKKNKISDQEALSRKYEGLLTEYAISTSNFISVLQEKCLLIGIKKHVVTGYPRNDALLNPETEIIEQWRKFIGYKKYKKIILYAPTWRNGRIPTIFFPFSDFNMDILNEFLVKNDILLLIRPHVNDYAIYSEIVDFMQSLSLKSNIVIANHNKFNDVNSILSFIDVLITDYSAIYHDFLLLNRPIIFIPYDYQGFAAQDGFLYDYYENLPGKTVNSQEQFLYAISEICENIDNYEDKRKKLCDKIHYYQDNKACARVYALIEEILNKHDK